MASNDDPAVPPLSRATSGRTRRSSRSAPEGSSRRSSSHPPPYTSARPDIGRPSSRSSRPKAQTSGGDGIEMLPVRPPRAHRSFHSRATRGDAPEITDPQGGVGDRHSSFRSGPGMLPSQLTWGAATTSKYWGVTQGNPKSWVGGGSDSNCPSLWYWRNVYGFVAVTLLYQ
ncbi:hypothetical protein MGYG_02399 [Nannizzia gypsea CBS 118893]|uniref:Uncharacterized protein n=1 Tax=Arthroderma gypseum (strain ATCC MYA-4604 / CBS 118893) TaxID=535722 RepID=E4URG5_ARTGP|nr:hypothetical protein MGYG_02399 [Nannizzia gypsea CBS 118893]EFQ99387.1 hypothetical protein MGYG_02399 [Nannizzia gypsea CBS 118893]